MSSPPSSVPPPGRFWIRLVGSFAMWRDGVRLEDRDIASRKARTLLKVLLLAPEEPVPLDRLADILWSGTPPDRVERHVATLVSRLRSLLGAHTIEGGAAGVYTLRLGDDLDVDVVEAEGLAAEARRRLSSGEHALAWSAAQRGLELIGEHGLLEDEPTADWATEARGSLTMLRRELRRCGWEAATELGDETGAENLARDALRADPLDERACRVLMLASQRDGDVTSGLLAYERLRSVLAEQLGVDPSPPTRQLHLALLRGEPLTPSRPDGGSTTILATPRDPPAPRRTVDLVGRERELAQLERHWSAATDGRTSLVVVTGEAGIGKTRLVTEAAAVARETGGEVVRVRCYAAERSLFLAPITEMVTAIAGSRTPEQLREAAGPLAGSLAQLVPERGTALGPPDHPSDPQIERRRTFEAITSLLRHLTRDRPLLVFLDDLHNAGSSTLELLHYVARHLEGCRLHIVATLRVEEGSDALRELDAVAERLEVGPLSDDAVATLAHRAGAAEFGPRIHRMTRGHTLAVVETLQALADADEDLDEPPIPASLKAAVIDRVERTGPDVEEFLRGAATLGSTFDLGVAADLLEIGDEEAVRRAERAVQARLLVEDGMRFAFSNDLFQEIVDASTPAPTRVARHRRAARLLRGRPEAVAIHASAAGDWEQAAASWREAADEAASRYANRDAQRLLDRAEDAARRVDDPVVRGHVLLARAHVREILADYMGAFRDLEAAAEFARASAAPELEASALTALGGDVIVGLGRPSTDCLPYLDAGLQVARTAGLGRQEVEILGRLAVIWTNRARFDQAAQMAAQALRRARQLDDERALALALDAVKTVSAYTGDLDTLGWLLPELEQLLQGQRDLNLLQWTVFESVIPPLARAEWDGAFVALDRATALIRRTGFPYGPLFLAHRSWLHHARGEYGHAISDAGRAVEQASTAAHPWWLAFGEAMLGRSLSDSGQQTDAIRHLRKGVAAAEHGGNETYLVRCVSHLALALWRNGDVEAADRELRRADELLAGVTTAPDRAFLHGAHAYAAAVRVHIARGELDVAEHLLTTLRDAAESVGWIEVVAVDRVSRGRCQLLAGRLPAARSLLAEAVELAEGPGLLPVAWEAHAGLALIARELHDRAAETGHQDSMAALRATMATSIEDEVSRQGYLDLAARRETAPTGEPIW